MKPRTIIGILLIFFGLALFACGAYVLMQAMDRNASDLERIQRADASCQEQLVTLGTVTVVDDVVELVIADAANPDGITDPRSVLADATASLAMCPGRQILEACVGTTCGSSPTGPVMMTLRLGKVQ